VFVIVLQCLLDLCYVFVIVLYCFKLSIH